VFFKKFKGIFAVNFFNFYCASCPFALRLSKLFLIFLNFLKRICKKDDSKERRCVEKGKNVLEYVLEGCLNSCLNDFIDGKTN